MLPRRAAASPRPGAGRTPGDHVMAIETEQAAIRMIIASAISQQSESSGRVSDALLAMQQAEAVVRALVFAGYEIRRRAG
jgi:hypothetical protein